MLKCRQLNLTPTHITNGTSKLTKLLHHTKGRTGCKITNFNRRLGRSIINLEIKVSNSLWLGQNSYNITDQLSRILPGYILEGFTKKQQIAYNKLFNKIKHTNLNKLEKLKCDNFSLLKTQDKWFKNLTNIDIPSDVISFLSLGPKFSLCPSTAEIKYSYILADLERIISFIPDESQKDCLRSQYTNILNTY